MNHKPVNFQPTLSVCLIVLNEAEYLEDCLRSVQALATEIIVVDTGSVDQSREIASSFGAKIYQIPWQDDFSVARNEAIAQATSDWILFIDADERLLPASLDKLKETLIRFHPGLLSEAPVIQVQIQNLNDHGKVDKIHYLARLFPRLPEFHYQGRIHEQLVPIAGRTQYRRESGICLLHHGYTHQALEAKKKAQRNIRLLRLQIQEDPRQADWYSYLADSLRLLNSEATNQEALVQYLHAIKIWPHEKQNSPRFLTTLSKCLKHMLVIQGSIAAIDFAQIYLTRNDLGPDFLFYSGEAYRLEGQKSLAKKYFQNCLELAKKPEKIKGTYDQTCLTDLPLARLIYLAYRDLQAGNLDAAQELKAYAEALLKLTKRSIEGIPLGLFLTLALVKNQQSTLMTELNYPYTEAEIGLMTALQILFPDRFETVPDWLKQKVNAQDLDQIKALDLDKIRDLWKLPELKLRWVLIGILFVNSFDGKHPEAKTCLVDLLQSIGQGALAKKLYDLLS